MANDAEALRALAGMVVTLAEIAAHLSPENRDELNELVHNAHRIARLPLPYDYRP